MSAQEKLAKNGRELDAAWKACDYAAVRRLTEERKRLAPPKHDAVAAQRMFGR